MWEKVCREPGLQIPRSWMLGAYLESTDVYTGLDWKSRKGTRCIIHFALWIDTRNHRQAHQLKRRYAFILWATRDWGRPGLLLNPILTVKLNFLCVLHMCSSPPSFKHGLLSPCLFGTSWWAHNLAPLFLMSEDRQTSSVVLSGTDSLSWCWEKQKWWWTGEYCLSWFSSNEIWSRDYRQIYLKF